MERPGLTYFAASPQGDHILVFYFEGKIEKSRYVACMLDTKSGQCTPLDIDIIYPNQAVWIDNQTVAILSLLREITLVDSVTLKSRSIKLENQPISIATFALIPKTHKLILSVTLTNVMPLSPVRLYTLDLDAEVFEALSYTSLFNDNPLNETTVSAWSFSPDRDHLFYGNLGDDGKMALVEFQTGKVIGIFDKVTQASWLADNRLIFIEGFQNPPPLLEVNALTGQTKTLIADATGMVIIN